MWYNSRLAGMAPQKAPDSAAMVLNNAPVGALFSLVPLLRRMYNKNQENKSFAVINKRQIRSGRA
jgi:hypothetical protein